VQSAISRAGVDLAPYSAHGLRADFIKYADNQGKAARDIAPATPLLASLDGYVRINDLW
jgi:hypothetical protein